MIKRKGTSRYVSIGLLSAIAAATGWLAAPGCSPDSPLDFLMDPAAGRGVDCATVRLSYETFGAPFLQEYCLRCHRVTRETDLQRLDAPQGIDFDTLGLALEFKKRIRLRAAELGDMPPRLMPVPKPSREERIQLADWIDCGMLTEAELDGG